MQTRRLYRVTRADGGVDVMPTMPDGGEYTMSYRLIADEGHILTDGTTQTPCVDTATPEAWSEVPWEDDSVPDHIPAWDVTQSEFIYEGDRVSRDGIIYRCISGHYAAWNKQPPNADYWEEET